MSTLKRYTYDINYSVALITSYILNKTYVCMPGVGVHIVYFVCTICCKIMVSADCWVHYGIPLLIVILYWTWNGLTSVRVSPGIHK